MFLIYDPMTKKAFCKDIVVDLNCFDQFPQYPRNFNYKERAKQKIRFDVWKKWREDSEKDVKNAFLEDIKTSFAPEVYIKDKDDIEECKQILLENFKILQISYIEGLAESSSTYPEISFSVFANQILSKQKTYQDK